MTTFDRVERHLPELFEEIAGAGIPDYFDDMLRVTTRARQRPSWSALERWLPMGVIARPLPIRPVPWRLIALVALVGLLAAATLAYVGTRTRVPPPFGPAANGVITIGTAAGDIETVDPTTGAMTPLISGPTFDGGPAYLSDGQRFLFDRGTSATDTAPALFIANADGTGIRRLLADESGIVDLEMSPTNDRVLVTRKIGDTGTLSILDVASATSTPLDLGLNVVSAAWRPNHDQLVIGADGATGHGFYVVNPDGSGERPIAVSQDAIIAPTISPDGSQLAYATWEPTSPPGRIRVVDIDRGGDHALTTNQNDGYTWQSPQFSPDGKTLLLYQFNDGSNPVTAQLAVMAVDGDGTATAMGPVSENPQPQAIFSPDGTKILATYSTLAATWMFDADGRNGRQVPFTETFGQTWQRQAP